MATAIVVPVLATIAFFAMTIYSTVNSSNVISTRRQAAGLERTLEVLQNVHALEQIGYSIWPEAYANIVTKFNHKWTTYNFGKDALSYTSVENWIVIDENDNLLFSSDPEVNKSGEAWTALRQEVFPALTKIRSLYAEILGRKEDLRRKRVGTTLPGLFLNDFGVINGKPVLFTVTAFIDGDDGSAPERARLLIGTHPVTSVMVQQIEQMVQIENLAIEPANRETAHSVEDSSSKPKTLALRDSAHKHVLSIHWTPYLSGRASIRDLYPVLFLALAVIAGVTGVLTLFMVELSRRSTENERLAIAAARVDYATGLANRAWFNERFEKALRDDAEGAVRGILIIDCDHFKQINDTHGHAAGDTVIASIGDRLRSLSDKIEISGRLGGDEFAVVSIPLGSEAAVSEFAKSVLETLSKPVLFEGKLIDVSVSVGAVASNSEVEESRKLLLTKADVALYKAKRTRRGSVAIADKDTHPSTDTQEPQALHEHMAA